MHSSSQKPLGKFVTDQRRTEWSFIMRRSVKGTCEVIQYRRDRTRVQGSTMQQFGKYVLQRKLAEGGMAEVFLAKQSGMEGFEKLVVVKRILPQLCSDESFVKMFLNEARVAARLNHPNVVQIFDLGKLGDQYFIAMEYVHGEDLRDIIRVLTDKGDRPSLALACRIIADTLAGLHYAHTRVGADGKPLGLVHRDVSPANVLVTYEGS